MSTVDAALALAIKKAASSLSLMDVSAIERAINRDRACWEALEKGMAAVAAQDRAFREAMDNLDQHMRQRVDADG